MRQSAYRFLMWINAIAMVVIAVVGISVLVPSGNWVTEPKSALRVFQVGNEFLRLQSQWLLKTSAVILGATNLLAKHIGPDWVWRTITNLLYDYRKVRFSSEVDDQPEYANRVTLFQHVHLTKAPWILITWRFWKSCVTDGILPWKGEWLFVVRRSGRLKTRTDTIFIVDSNNPHKCEGIAGQAWVNNSQVTVDLECINNQTSEDTVLKYANESNVSVKWVKDRLKEKKHFPCTIMAQPFEVDNEPWGVLVLDSIDAKNLKSQKQKEMQKLILNTLDDLLSNER